MSAAVGAGAPATREAPSWLEVALLGLALAAAGLVVLALGWSGTTPYADLARANGATSTVFFTPGGDPVRLDLPEVIDMHRAWSFYVTGGGEPPVFTDVRFTDDEVAHMIDVRHVFDVVKLAVPTGLFIVIVRLQRARLRGSRAMWRLVRDGAVAALLLVALIGAAAALAFEPMFLLFHRAFFPQGNFLFDPATSDLVRLYPDWYWEGITLRVGASFVVGAAALAAIAATRLRASR